MHKDRHISDVCHGMSRCSSDVKSPWRHDVSNNRCVIAGINLIRHCLHGEKPSLA